MKKNGYHNSKTILPISWEVDYSKYLAIVKVKNISTNYSNTVMVDYRLFSFDPELSEATLNMALMEEVRSSFGNDDNYLDWLAYSVDKGLIEDSSV